MAQIMCTRPLLRRLGVVPPRRRPVETVWAGIRLGSWGATAFADQGREIVLAVEQRTQLAIVFSWGPAAEFKARFVAALTSMLEELDVPPAAVQAEATAVEFAPLTLLGRQPLRESMTTLKYICEIELMYHEDLGIVQSNLNEFPHARPPYVSKLAVAELFGLAIPAWAAMLRE